jgi:hypothetical protein
MLRKPRRRVASEAHRENAPAWKPRLVWPPATNSSLRGVEQMEPRLTLSVEPVFVGSVYIEEDPGSDRAGGDSFYVSLEQGAPGSQLVALEIDGDQNAPGFNVGDVFFDTDRTPDASGPARFGAEEAFDFTIVQNVGIDRVKAIYADGTSLLRLEFEGFDPGDTLRFSIDVDEVEDYDPNETDITTINRGFDPITSGVEFQASAMRAWVKAPNFEDAQLTSKFFNHYDANLDPTPLQLPEDDYSGKRDRTAGAVAQHTQQPLPAQLAGHVYHDRNQNGRRDAGEEGIAGVVVEAIPVDTVVEQEILQVRTGANGAYSFPRLMPGSYRIRESQPDGYLDGLDAAGTVNGRPVGQAVNPGDLIEDVLLAGGASGVDYDFGELRSVSLSGRVHLATANGDCFGKDQEHQPVVGALLQLVDASGAVVAETRSDANGRYAFLDVAPGVYSVREVTPTGLIDGGAKAGTVDGTERGVVASSGEIANIRLGSGERVVDIEFCEKEPVSIRGRVHLATRDGDCFSSEAQNAPLADVEVRVYNSQGQLAGSTRTDAAGQYAFQDLPPDVYRLVEVTPEGLLDGGAKAGLVDGTSVGEVAGPGEITRILLGPGQDAVEYDFCEHPPSQLAGFVYHDRNDDGTRQSDEEAIDRVELRLLDAQGVEVGRTTTDADGRYAWSGLTAGLYTIVETQPAGWVDGQDSPGTVDGQVRGVAVNPGDRIDAIDLQWGESGIDYAFGELRASSIAGIVHTDVNRDCLLQENERPLPGVVIELLDQQGTVLATQATDAEGRFLFTGLPVGVYTLREQQPEGYFQGGQQAGSGGGDDATVDFISSIVVGSGLDLVDYRFCEVPPSEISGVVFQDGPAIQLRFNEELPDDLQTLRDGQLTDDDQRLAGVVLELRDGVDGTPIDASAALPGYYAAGPIRTTTDGRGSYRFAGLPKGSYAVYEIQPAGFVDSIDTAGTLPAIAVNRGEPIDPQVMAALTEDPNFDAIIRIALPPDRASDFNNFSEVRVTRLPVPIFPRPQEPFPEAATLASSPPVEAVERIVEPASLVRTDYGRFGRVWGQTWHLSVIAGGSPRGEGLAVAAPRSPWSLAARQAPASSTTTLYSASWDAGQAERLQWELLVDGAPVRRLLFGPLRGIPVAGDFNGDGFDEGGIFLDGQWFIDINGNGQWDDQDLWAKLGYQGDQPVVGDWDGDGKDDIGVFGLAWPGDPRAVQREPGLPDRQLSAEGKQRSTPPTDEQGAQVRREMQYTAAGAARSDVVDHVFHYGTHIDRALVGDWNGDGISNIAIFHDGVWHLDMNGDGSFDGRQDQVADFGAEGDLPLAGDFNGDGVDEIAIVRGGRVIIDTNRNFRVDDSDQVLPLNLSNPNARLVVGDWNGDGRDDIGMAGESLKFVEIQEHEPRR